MSKISSASIRLVQKMNRKTKNGENPIYIVVCYHGRLEKSCGVSCLPRDWDGKREMIKKSCPNYVILNRILNDIKQRVIDRKLQYELDGIEYSPLMLLSDGEKVDRMSSIYKDVMEHLIEERRLKDGTVSHYLYSFRLLVGFIGRDNFLIQDVTIGVIKDFLDSLGISDNTKRDICRTIASVWNYAIRKRVVNDDLYPFRDFMYTQRYSEKNREYYLEKEHIRLLYDYFLDLVIERDGDSWSYRDGALERLHDRMSYEFGILWFCLCYKLNGSSPIDVAKLRIDDCRRILINGEDYWAIDFKRQKTSRCVSVRWKRDMFSIIALEHFMGMSKDGFIYPMKGDRAITDKQIDKSIHYCASVAIKSVRRAFEVINEGIIKRNVENGGSEVLVDVGSVELYTARHSMANHLLDDPSVSVRELASILSRSPNTISTYIKSLTKNEDIASIVSSMAI